VREFSASNATGPSISFGRGFGQGGNSDVVAGGSAVSDATANNGGAAETGFAPVDAVASTSQGGKTTFIGIGSSSAINMGSGFFLVTVTRTRYLLRMCQVPAIREAFLWLRVPLEINTNSKGTRIKRDKSNGRTITFVV
jgi:hypothetical protein